MAKKRKKPDWRPFTLKMKENHGWSCKPGYRIFVADRGAVRFDFPRDWISRHDDLGTIYLHDRQPPDDDCRLSLSVLYLRDDLDFSKLKLAEIMAKFGKERSRGSVTKGPDGGKEFEVTEVGPVIDVKHPRHDLAWRESRFPDTETGRMVCSRTALARWSNIQIVLTFEFWADLSPRFGKEWDEILRTLVLGDYVEDPTQRLPLDPLDDIYLT